MFKGKPMETKELIRSEIVSHRRKSSIRFTYEDYLQFPDDGKRFEIIDGELFMTPSPLTKHQRISGNLLYLLHSFLKTEDIGECFVAPLDVVISPTDVVQPDLFVVLHQNKNIITEKNISGAPDFIIEILSPSNSIMDLKRKRVLYEMYGVEEYWIVDPATETVLQLVLQNSQFVEIKKYLKDEIISSEVVKNFTIEIKKIFQ